MLQVTNTAEPRINRLNDRTGVQSIDVPLTGVKVL